MHVTMNSPTRWFPIALIAPFLACTRLPPPVTPPSAPVVEVVRPSVRKVVDYQDFTGRTRASDTTDLKARVTGYLSSIHFRDGDRVTAKQTLIQLDPGLYATELARAEAVVKQMEATVARLTKDYLRVKGLPAASQTEKDQTEGQLAEAKAAVEVAQKQVAQAKKNVEYLTIKAPKDGRIGRHLLDIGNLVKADETLLATIVVTDPIHVYFDVDDRTMLRLNRLIADGKLNLSADSSTQTQIGLPDEDGFSLTGTVRFIDTQLNPGTGTITLRADVPNPKGLLTPGLFVRVRLPIGEGKRSILVPEEAIGTDQGLKFVFVLNDQDEVEYRPVNLGLQDGNDRVVEPVPGKPNSGVKEGDRVITEGLQRVRKGMKVTVKGSDQRKSGQ
jgi:RND family efflux transporter MFP subunit